MKDDTVPFTELLVTFNPGDLAFIKSLLNANGIRYFIEGENFLHIRPLVVPARIMVKNDQLQDARELLKDFKSGSFGSQVDP